MSNKEVPIILPKRIHTLPEGSRITSSLACGGSLYISFWEGLIEEWKIPPIISNSFLSPYRGLSTLCEWENYICSGCFDKTIRLWDKKTGECVKIIYTIGQITSLTVWNNKLVNGSWNDSSISIWGHNEECTRLNTESRIHAMIIWRGMLCCGHSNSTITVWNQEMKRQMLLQGHIRYVYCFTVFEEFLFSGSDDCQIRKWDPEGNCLAVIKHHKELVSSLLVNKGNLYSASYDKTIKKFDLEGNLLEIYQGHTMAVKTIIIWKGALFSGGFDEKVIQWTNFHLWSIQKHKEFPQYIREAIKVTMTIALLTKNCPLPKDVLYIVFQFLASFWS